MTSKSEDILKEIYHHESKDGSVSIKVMGDTYVHISVAKHFSYSQVLYFIALLVSNYFLCTKFIPLVLSHNVFISFLYSTTVLFCSYKIYQTIFNTWKQNIIFVSNIGLQITTLNLLQRESSEYLSYCDIENFAIVEMFHRQFSVVTYLSCLLKNEKHKILFENFSLKLAQLEVMYQSVKHVLASRKIGVFESS